MNKFSYLLSRLLIAIYLIYCNFQWKYDKDRVKMFLICQQMLKMSKGGFNNIHI